MLNCQQHDSIELVCMFRYPLKLALKSGELVSCIAVDTVLNQNRDECMAVAVKGKQRLVVLDQIARLDVCVENPHLRSVSFD